MKDSEFVGGLDILPKIQSIDKSMFLYLFNSKSSALMGHYFFGVQFSTTSAVTLSATSVHVFATPSGPVWSVLHAS